MKSVRPTNVLSTKQKRTTTTVTVSSQLNYKLIQLRKHMQKMQKFVVAVLKKLLNGYSVILVYYGYTLHVLPKNINVMQYLITTFVNSLILSMTLNSIIVCLFNICLIVFISYY